MLPKGWDPLAEHGKRKKNDPKEDLRAADCWKGSRSRLDGCDQFRCSKLNFFGPQVGKLAMHLIHQLVATYVLLSA